MNGKLGMAVRTHVSLVTLVGLVLLLLGYRSSAASLVIGAAFALLNLGLWVVLVRGFVGAVARKGNLRRGWLWLGLVGKIVAFAALAGVAWWKLPLEPVAFGAGVVLLSVGFVRLALGPTPTALQEA